MKKTLIISILFVMITLLAATTVNAVTATSIVNDVYELGKKYGVTNADKVKGERYIADNPITDAQAEIIYAKAKEAVAILEEAGVTNVKKLDTQLNKDQKLRFKNICQEGADVLGVTLVYRNGEVDVYKDSKKIDTYTFTDKLSYTGSNVNVVLVISLITISTISAVFIIRKKFANA